MRSVLIDTAVVLHAVGAEHPLKDPCRRVLTEPSLEICASVEMIQEVVFHRMRVGDRIAAVREAEQWAQACRLYPFDHEVLAVALSLIERHGTGGRDAVHAATALVHGIPEIVSHDKAFDGIEGLTRIDPRDFDGQSG